MASDGWTRRQHGDHARSRSPHGWTQSKCRHPCHPHSKGSGEGPSQALSSDVKEQIGNLTWEAWHHGDKVKPWDVDWLGEYHKRSIGIMRRLCQEPNACNVLWQTKPRNPATKRYEKHISLEDTAAFLKHLMNMHPGEVREIKSEWTQMETLLPDDPNWYLPVYAKDELEAGEVNSFLWKGCHPGEHWQRHAKGLSLPRLLDLFRNQYTAEVIYEAFTSLPPLVLKKKKGSSCAWPPAMGVHGSPWK